MWTAVNRFKHQKGVRKARPEPFTREEMQAILSQYWRMRTEEIRDKALIVFLYRGATRIGATLRMLPGDIDWKHSIVRIYKDKGGKTRSISFDDRTMGFLRRWKEKRANLGIGDDKPFFCTFHNGSTGNPLAEENVLQGFVSKCRMAGITRHVNLHLLRHTGASELLEEGFDVGTISRVLGHASIITTFRYLHELRPDLMNAKLAQREW
jgi:site-specific recombinase XerD